MHRAAALLAHAKESIRKARPELKRVTIAGDFRRGCELVGDLAIVVQPAKSDQTWMPSAEGLQVRVSDRIRRRCSRQEPGTVEKDFLVNRVFVVALLGCP